MHFFSSAPLTTFGFGSKVCFIGNTKWNAFYGKKCIGMTNNKSDLIHMLSKSFSLSLLPSPSLLLLSHT